MYRNVVDRSPKLVIFCIGTRREYCQPFKAFWLLAAPTSLTFKNCTLCPHCICVFYLSENKERVLSLTA